MSAFDGKVVLVTGASSGIGAALAREFARQGADVALLARRADRLEAIAAELRQMSRRAAPIACDVTSDGDLNRGVERVLRELGRIDVAVANAGFGVVGPFERLTVADYRRQFETNVFGLLETAYASLEALKQTRGCLVLMGSVAGYVSAPSSSPYSMSKFAVRALARAMRFELARHGVAVVLISPGFVESEIRQVDNRGVWHPRAKEPLPAWLTMATDRAARQIVRAVARRRREIVITKLGKTLVFLERHAPWALRGLITLAGIRFRSDPSVRRQ